jgi:superfamily II DNA helicase RecQ
MSLRFDEEFEILKTNQFRTFLKEYEQYNDSRVFVKKMIISYHTLRDEVILEYLKQTSLYVDVLIMDEAHSFRNNETSTFEGAALITGLSEHILFLTATPVQNKLSDLFNILSLLDGESFLDEDYFEKSIRPNALIHRIVSNLKNQGGLEKTQELIRAVDKEYLQLNHHQQLLFDRFLSEKELSKEERIDYIKRFTDADNLSYIINRTKKKDVGKFIPRKAVSQTVQGTQEEIAFYEEVIDFVKLLFQFKNPRIPSGFITIMPERMASSCMLASIESFKKMRKSRKLYVGDFDDRDEELVDIDIQEFLLDKLDILIDKGLAIGEKDSKYDAFEKLVDGLKEKDVDKMIVFSFFKKTLSYLENKLTNKGIRVGKIDGDLSPEERYEIINDFRENKFDILLSSEVGSEGLDMQFCNVVVNYDLPWNPMRVEQRIGRIDRIGQTAEKLLIFNLCIEGTVEDRILNRLYSKLNIFENSIGELEPILGDIQTTFDVREVIDMTDEELQRVLDLKAQSLIAKKKEIQEQTVKLDGMLNEDYRFDESYENYINGTKETFVRNSVQSLFLSYLDQENIQYSHFKDGTYRLNKEESNQLFELMKAKMVDAREKSVYNVQKKALLKLKKSKSYHFSFTKMENAEYSLEYISLSHPFVKMISKVPQFPLYGTIAHKKYSSGYVIVYRENISTFKQTSSLKVLCLDENYHYLNSMNYYDFLADCQNSTVIGSIQNLQEVKFLAEPLIIQSVEKKIAEKNKETSRLLDEKIRALKEYYAKKRSKAQKMKEKVNDLDVIRMRQAQISNLYELEEKKITSLEKQKRVTGSHSILVVMEIVNE